MGIGNYFLARSIHSTARGVSSKHAAKRAQRDEQQRIQAEWRRTFAASRARQEARDAKTS